jgi:hypothetical protein
MMKRQLTALTILVLVASTVGCKVRLSQEEAKDLIEREFGYPRPSYTYVAFWGAQVPEVWDYLTKNGNRESSPVRVQGLKSFYQPTATAKRYVGSEIEMNREDNNLGFQCGYLIGQIKVTEVLIDRKTDTASVRYVVAWEYNEPFASVVRRNHKFIDEWNATRLRSPERRSVEIKRFDKGWRVLGAEDRLH